MGATTAMDRLAMRVRPEGSPVMEQNWENLLFLHWPVAENLLRPLIPAPLEIDTFDGRAWIGITPFRLSGLRLLSLPPIPGLDAFNECSVRTYVHHRGSPGLFGDGHVEFYSPLPERGLQSAASTEGCS